MVTIRRQYIYLKIANELLCLPEMTKYEIIDWWLDKQDNGFLRADQLTVKELMYLQDHKELCCSVRNLIERDKPKILERMHKGETAQQVADSYKLNIFTFYRNLDMSGKRKGRRLYE